MTPDEIATVCRSIGVRDAAPWIEAFESFDFAPVMIAARQVIRSGVAPTVDAVADAYADVVSQRTDSRYPSFHEGVRIAWLAYVTQCRTDGVIANPETFRAWIGATP